ncbi:DUF1826 domain-containing protein [Sphingopyxis sp. LARHCG72]
MTALDRSHALVAGNAGVLEAIRDPDISIAIWERGTPYALGDILSPDLRSVHVSASAANLPLALTRALEAARYPLGDARATLEMDILDLARRFAAIMRVAEVDIRLDRIAGNACRKFHADYVTARLITTYIGRGTQWLDAHPSKSCDCDEPHNLREMRAGDVAIFKGRHWDEDHAAIHRSPPIAGSGEQRLLLVINPLEQPGQGTRA